MVGFETYGGNYSGTTYVRASHFAGSLSATGVRM
jgi:hypothetical protein